MNEFSLSDENYNVDKSTKLQNNIRRDSDTGCCPTSQSPGKQKKRRDKTYGEGNLETRTIKKIVYILCDCYEFRVFQTFQRIFESQTGHIE